MHLTQAIVERFEEPAKRLVELRLYHTAPLAYLFVDGYEHGPSDPTEDFLCEEA